MLFVKNRNIKLDTAGFDRGGGADGCCQSQSRTSTFGRQSADNIDVGGMLSCDLGQGAASNHCEVVAVIE